MKGHRVLAVALRHLFIYRRSFARLLEVFYFPVINLLVWGFFTVYLQEFRKVLPDFVLFLIGALILWEMLYRSQLGVSIAFLEEVWSRNLLNLFGSPLKPTEFVAAACLISLLKLLVSATVSIVSAWVFFDFHFFKLGLALLPFVLNLLILGWSVGILTTACVLRYGQKTEILAWGLPFLLQPLCAVFYPLSVFPPPLAAVARAIPATHVFEGMREVLQTGGVEPGSLLWAFGLNAFYFGLSLVFFLRTFDVVREKGLLLKVGE